MHAFRKIELFIRFRHRQGFSRFVPGEKFIRAKEGFAFNAEMPGRTTRARRRCRNSLGLNLVADELRQWRQTVVSERIKPAT